MTQRTLDPYAVLGVPRDASPPQVRAAYRRLARSHHPDLHSGADANERMRSINQAWQILSSPVRRAGYDAGNRPSAAPVQGHWSAPRQTAARSAAASSRAWQARAYAAEMRSEQESPRETGWVAVGLTALVLPLLLVAIFAGVLPRPLFGIVLFVILALVAGRLR